MTIRTSQTTSLVPGIGCLLLGSSMLTFGSKHFKVTCLGPSHLRCDITRVEYSVNPQCVMRSSPFTILSVCFFQGDSCDFSKNPPVRFLSDRVVGPSFHLAWKTTDLLARALA